MSNDKTVRDGFLDTVVNQMNSGEPPETRATHARLVAEGYSDNEALHLMSAALRMEMNRMLAEARPFDTARYCAMLRKLPSLEG